MRLLLDTHTLLWLISDNPEVSPNVREAVNDPDNEVFVSVASVWEISIKRSRGRLDAPENLVEQLKDSDYTTLLVNLDHADLAGRLPMHHRDPFDRMLVAQAQVEDLVMVTRDRFIPRYEVETLTA